MKSGRYSLPLLIIAISGIVLVPSISYPAMVEISDVSFWSYPEYTRVAISLSGSAEYSRRRLSNPDRLCIDIKNGKINKELKSNLSVENGMLKAIRAGQFDLHTVRVVLDLEKIIEYKIISDDPEKIIIDVYGNTVLSLKKKIVIDAGHGGHDPGAVGPNKLYEKDVVLDIALKLKKILSQFPNLEVFLTRDKDVFLKLDERTAIANSKNADLFVSVHANASTSRAAKGIETYLLNWTNDEEALKVAARENQISLRKMRSMHREMSDLDITLSDLRRDNKRDESIKLANYIQRRMVADLNSEYDEITDHGVKGAFFYVLYGAQMPSVLVEVSFISNPREERRLSKEKYRTELANSIAVGIEKYISVSTEIKSVAGLRKSVVSGN